MENRTKAYLAMTAIMMLITFVIGLFTGLCEARQERNEFSIQKIDGTFYMVTFGNDKKVYQCDGFDFSGKFRILNR